MTAWEKIAQKTLVGSNLDSRQWNGIQAGLRDRAFFSSKVAEINILDAARHVSAEYSKGQTDLSKLRMELRDYIQRGGYTPKEGEEGTIKDLTTKARLDVIIKTNVAQARGFIQWADGQTPGAFAAFPCQEFVRVERRKKPRQDWLQRWKAAGGETYGGGRMIAPKNSPVWVRLNKTFGTPYPPFDWGSGMGVVDVSRREALRLGVITDDEIKSEVAKLREKQEHESLPSMNGNLQATVPATQDVFNQMRAYFGDLADVVRVNDAVQIKWRPEILRETVLQMKDFRIECGEPQEKMLDLLRADPKMTSFAANIEGKQLVVDQTWRDQKRSKGGTHLRHFKPMPKEPNDIPLRPEDLEMVPSMWRSPDRVIKIGGDKFLAECDAFDGSTYMMQIWIDDGTPKLWAFFRTKTPTSKKLGRT